MPTLASIPESSTAPLHPGALRLAKPPRPSTASFERPRPRSRVLIISRRPSRGRKLLPKLSVPGDTNSIDNDGRRTPRFQQRHRHSTKSLENSATNFNNNPSYHAVSQDHVSDPNSLVEETFEPSDGSVDLDSFPAPPFNENTVREFSYLASPIIAKPKNAGGMLDTTIKYLPRAASSQPQTQHVQASRTSTKSPRVRDDVLEGSPDLLDPSRQESANSALVEAVSRNVAQQLRLFSFSGQPEIHQHGARNPSGTHLEKDDSESQTSSQRHALDRFTRELQKYAEMTSAQGKVPNFTPTATSSATLRTVSALMPFRSELRAAGLAVTSNDQRHNKGHLRSSNMQPSRNHSAAPEGRRRPPTQVDGNDEDSSHTPYTEISFAPSRSVDEWRYALIDEVPPRKEKKAVRNKSGQSCCFPCVGNEDQTTDGGHSNKATGHPVANGQNFVAPATSKVPPLPQREAPRPPSSGPSGVQLNQVARPQHKASEHTITIQPEATQHKRVYRSASTIGARATGLRRPSMTLSHTSIPLESCQGGHHFRKDAGVHHKHNVRPKTRAELAQLGQVLPLFPVKPLQKKPLPLRHQSLPVNEIAHELPHVKPLRARKNAAASSLPEMPMACAFGTTSSLEEAMVRAATKAIKKEDEAASRKPSNATQTSERDAGAKPNKRPSTCNRGSKGVSKPATIQPSIPRRTSSIRTSLHTAEFERENREITDREVLRGLHIAVSAACDEEVDILIRNKTGLQIRRFLADLMLFEALGKERPEDGEQRARRRRSEMRKLKQHVRRSRELGRRPLP